jgi:hypothetical protein
MGEEHLVEEKRHVVRKIGDERSLVTMLIGKGFSAIMWKGEEMILLP